MKQTWSACGCQITPSIGWQFRSSADKRRKTAEIAIGHHRKLYLQTFYTTINFARCIAALLQDFGPFKAIVALLIRVPKRHLFHRIGTQVYGVIALFERSTNTMTRPKYEIPKPHSEQMRSSSPPFKTSCSQNSRIVRRNVRVTLIGEGRETFWETSGPFSIPRRPPPFTACRDGFAAFFRLPLP